MATVRPSGAGDEAVGTGEVVDGGAVIHGGNVASTSPVSKNLSLDTLADDFGESFGSKVLVNPGSGTQYTDRAGVSQARASQAGTIAYNATATQWIMQGGNVSTTINNAASTKLISAAADSEGMNATRDMVAGLETTRDLGSMDIDVLAAPASGINSYRTITGGGTEKNFVRPSGAGTENSLDSNANATRAVPGNLTYMFGGKNPQQDDYKAKDSFES